MESHSVTSSTAPCVENSMNHLYNQKVQDSTSIIVDEDANINSGTSCTPIAIGNNFESECTNKNFGNSQKGAVVLVRSGSDVDNGSEHESDVTEMIINGEEDVQVISATIASPIRKRSQKYRKRRKRNFAKAMAQAAIRGSTSEKHLELPTAQVASVDCADTDATVHEVNKSTDENRSCSDVLTTLSMTAAVQSEAMSEPPDPSKELSVSSIMSILASDDFTRPSSSNYYTQCLLDSGIGRIEFDKQLSSVSTPEQRVHVLESVIHEACTLLDNQTPEIAHRLLRCLLLCKHVPLYYEIRARYYEAISLICMQKHLEQAEVALSFVIDHESLKPFPLHLGDCYAHRACLRFLRGLYEEGAADCVNAVGHILLERDVGTADLSILFDAAVTVQKLSVGAACIFLMEGLALRHGQIVAINKHRVYVRARDCADDNLSSLIQLHRAQVIMMPQSVQKILANTCKLERMLQENLNIEDCSSVASNVVSVKEASDVEDTVADAKNAAAVRQAKVVKGKAIAAAQKAAAAAAKAVSLQDLLNSLYTHTEPELRNLLHEADPSLLSRYDSKNGWQLVHFAVWHTPRMSDSLPVERVLDILAECKVDLLSKTVAASGDCSEGSTPLHVAVCYRNLRAFAWLIKRLGKKSTLEVDNNNLTVLNSKIWNRGAFGKKLQYVLDNNGELPSTNCEQQQHVGCQAQLMVSRDKHSSVDAPSIVKAAATEFSPMPAFKKTKIETNLTNNSNPSCNLVEIVDSQANPMFEKISRAMHEAICGLQSRHQALLDEQLLAFQEVDCIRRHKAIDYILVDFQILLQDCFKQENAMRHLPEPDTVNLASVMKQMQLSLHSMLNEIQNTIYYLSSLPKISNEFDLIVKN